MTAVMLYLIPDADNPFLTISELAKEVIAAVDVWRMSLDITSN